MKKIVIAAIVGSIILFAWNAVSWMVMPTHTHSFRYTPAQDSILHVLKNSGLTTGAYMIPSVDNGNLSPFDAEYQKKHEELMNAVIGHPMATLFYVDAFPA